MDAQEKELATKTEAAVREAPAAEATGGTRELPEVADASNPRLPSDAAPADPQTVSAEGLIYSRRSRSREHLDAPVSVRAVQPPGPRRFQL